MPTSMRPYRYLPLLLGSLALAGCVTTGSKNDAAYPTALTTLGNASPAPTTPAPASPKPVTPNKTPTYPLNAKGYAEAVIAAWKAKSQARLADLTTPEVHEQLIEIPGPPNMSWSFVECGGAAGSTYCKFTNADGHTLTLRLSNQKLGMPHAATEVKYQI